MPLDYFSVRSLQHSSCSGFGRFATLAIKLSWTQMLSHPAVQEIYRPITRLSAPGLFSALPVQCPALRCSAPSLLERSVYPTLASPAFGCSDCSGVRSLQQLAVLVLDFSAAVLPLGSSPVLAPSSSLPHQRSTALRRFAALAFAAPQCSASPALVNPSGRTLQ